MERSAQPSKSSPPNPLSTEQAPSEKQRFPLPEEWNDSRSGDFLWSNVNFGEAVSEVMTPLSWCVLRLVLQEWTFLPGRESVGNIGGRPYLNISVLASVLNALGRNRQEVLDTLAGTLYMQLPDEIPIPLIPISKRSLLTTLPNLIGIQMRQRQGVRRLPAYAAQNGAWCNNLRQQIQQAETKAELRALWQEELFPHLTSTVWIVLGSTTHATGYAMQLRKELTQLVGPDDASVLLSNVGRGTNSLASLGPVLGLAQMAQGTMDREVYLEQYGHRGPHEFELSVPRPIEDPAWLDQQIAQFHKTPFETEKLLAQQRSQFDAAWQDIQTRFPRQAEGLHRRIDIAAQRSRMREEARSEYVRDRWMARLFALRAGQLTGLEDDIFFLTMTEVLNVLAGHAVPSNTIRDRRTSYVTYQALPPYPTIILGPFDPIDWAADPHRRTDLFSAHPLPATPGPSPCATRHPSLVTGSAGSAGRVEGLVRRLDSPEQGEQLQSDEILVTSQTDIAWTPIFPRAAAVVTDVGAPLSHAAIIARELGIPAVVGCGDATMRLQTGDRVRVDGGQGTVEVLQ